MPLPRWVQGAELYEEIYPLAELRTPFLVGSSGTRRSGAGDKQKTHLRQHHPPINSSHCGAGKTSTIIGNARQGINTVQSQYKGQRNSPAVQGSRHRQCLAPHVIPKEVEA